MFLENKLLGSLTLEKIILCYEHPRIFIAKNEQGEEFLFLEYVASEAKDKWLVTKLSEARKNKLLKGEISVQGVMREAKAYYTVTKCYITDQVKAVEMNEPPRQVKLDSDYYYKK